MAADPPLLASVRNEIDSSLREADREVKSGAPPNPSGGGSLTLPPTPEWGDGVGKRLKAARMSLQRNQKRAMTFAAAALAGAASGLAMIINRALDGPAAASQLRPRTAIVLAGLAAVTLVVAPLLAGRRSRDPVPGRPADGGLRGSLHVAALILVTFAAVLQVSGASGSGPGGTFVLGHGSLGVALLAAAAGFAAISYYYAGKVKRIEADLSDLQFEQDLLRYRVEPFQNRAEKMLSVNQIQLRRYYELNLQQARAVFLVGLGCIAAGLGVVGLTFWLVFLLRQTAVGADDNSTQIVVAAVGGVGTVLTNVVAALYFKMHGSIGESLTKFHAQLAGTQELFFANVLASSIGDQAKRTDTLVKIALATADRHAKSASADAAHT